MKKNILANPKIMPILCLLCCLLWGSAFPSLKVLYVSVGANSPLEKMQQAGIRFIIAGIMILIFIIIQNSKSLDKKNISSIISIIKTPKSMIPIIIFVALMQTSIGYSLFYIGLGNIPAVKASILTSSGIFIMVILCHFFVKGERLNKQKTLGLVLGIGGIILVNSSNLGAFNSKFTLNGEGIFLLSSLLASFAALRIKLNANKLDVFLLTGWQLLLGGLLLVIVCFLSGVPFPSYDLKSFMLVIYLAIVSAVAFSLWYMMYKYHKPSEMAIYKFAVPLFGSALSIIFLQSERFRVEMLGALILVALGIIIININKSKFQKRH